MKYLSIILNIIFLTIAMYFCAVIFYKHLNTGLDEALQSLPAALTPLKPVDKSSIDSGVLRPSFYPRDWYDVILKRNLF